MKNILLVLVIFLLISCQRETRNELGAGYNKTLIIPPTNNLPVPNSSINKNIESQDSDNPVINSILSQTDAISASPNVIEEIDNESGYETDQLLFDRLFKGNKQ